MSGKTATNNSNKSSLPSSQQQNKGENNNATIQKKGGERENSKKEKSNATKDQKHQQEKQQLGGIDSSSETTNNPVTNLLNKKIRNLKKKVSNFENLQKKLESGHPLTEDQKKILNENTFYVKYIDELEKLKQELSPLVPIVDSSVKEEAPKKVEAPAPVVTERIVERWNDDAIFKLVNLLHFHFDQDPNAFENLDPKLVDKTHELANSIACLDNGKTTDASVFLVKQYITAGDNEQYEGVSFAEMRTIVENHAKKNAPAVSLEVKTVPSKQEEAPKSDWYSESQEKEEASQTAEAPKQNATQPAPSTQKQEGKKHEGEAEGKERKEKGNFRGRGKGYRNEPRQPQPDSEGFVEVEGREGSGRRGGNFRGRGGFDRTPRNQGEGHTQGGESSSNGGERRRGGNKPRGAPRGNAEGGASPKENRPPRPQGDKPNRGTGGRGRGRGEGQSQQPQVNAQ